ncbi:hypothetical protein GJAV_G00055900 [Gymnothorax javanicus]|nr:hypothetical protein GJAV_G00055900 [Gymnothorax javanicus]
MQIVHIRIRHITHSEFIVHGTILRTHYSGFKTVVGLNCDLKLYSNDSIFTHMALHTGLVHGSCCLRCNACLGAFSTSREPANQLQTRHCFSWVFNSTPTKTEVDRMICEGQA